MKRSLRLLAPLSILLLGSTALAKDLPNFDASWLAPRAAAPVPLVAPPPAFAASLDARRSVPSFLWAARRPSAPPVAGVTPVAAARGYLADQAARWGATRDAALAATITRVHDVGRGGIVVVFQQRVGDVELFHADAKVLMTRDLALVAIAGGLHPGAGARAKGAGFAIPERAAIGVAFQDLLGVALPDGDLVDLHEERGAYRSFGLAASSAASKSGLALTAPLRVKKVFFPMPDRLVPGYYVEVLAGPRTQATSDAYAYVIAADDGRLLYREDLTHHDTFQYRVWAEATGERRPADGPEADYTPHPTGTPDGTYPPFTAPPLVSMEGFNTNPSQASDPWLAAGATETRGNNVDAYTDDNAPDGFSGADVRATVTSPGVFDRVYDVSASPQASVEQRMAAVTDLFYVTNWLHDWWYDSGFDEAAGNAQKDNFGRGGLDKDPLHAEGQDGAPDDRNNANMSVPADGVSPRMQMYVWDGPSTHSLLLLPQNTSPATGVADFGPSSFDVTGGVVLADDGSGTTTDACEAITNVVLGQIVLVDRGSCSFKQKAVNAEAAGAIGMILANNVAGPTPPPMGNGNPNGPVAIGAESVTLAEGDALKTALGIGPVTATMKRVALPDRDGTIDNTVVAHEWGHYLHLRQVPCGLPICGAQSEGWADFTALQMLVRPGDDLGGTFALSQYATQGAPDDPGYFGIRRYPYSIDMTKSPLTFKHIQSSEPLPMDAPIALSAVFDNAEVHATGEVWASMLFEGFIALLQQSQGASPPYDFDEARRRMSDYVEVGLTLAPSDPTFIEQRDAVLAATIAADPDDFVLLAQGFAKRGAGTCAVAPPRDSFDFEGVVESFELKPNAVILGATVDDSVTSCDMDGFLDVEEVGKATVKIINNGTTTLTGAKVSVATKAAGVNFPKGTDADLPAIEPFATAVASFEVVLDGSTEAKQNLDLTVTVKSPEGCTTTTTFVTAPLVNLDEIPTASTADGVEATTTAWTTAGADAASIWAIFEATPGDHAWRGLDYASPSDTALVSPELDVGDADFVLSFSHRYHFETSDGIFWDGGVIEISTNGGKTWSDVSKIADPGYGGTIGDPDHQAKNVLSDRPGFVDQNASWPDRDPVSVNLGKTFAGKKVQLRFHMGTDDAAGDYGWELDDLAFQGITNQPFSALVDDASTCTAPAPDADAGPDVTVHPGETVTLDGSASKSGDEKPLSFAWSQAQGLEVVLAKSDGAQPSFVAPATSVPTKLTFQLTVASDKVTDSDTVDVLVDPGAAQPLPGGPYVDGGGCDCGVRTTGDRSAAFASLALALLGIARRRRRGP